MSDALALAERYREMAEEYRRLSTIGFSAETPNHYLRIAEHYSLLADIEKQGTLCARRLAASLQPSGWHHSHAATVRLGTPGPSPHHPSARPWGRTLALGSNHRTAATGWLGPRAPHRPTIGRRLFLGRAPAYALDQPSSIL